MSWKQNDIWVDNLRGALIELSDIQLQRDLWNARVPGRCSSYIELYSKLFDDFSVEEFVIKFKEFNLSEIFYAEATKLITLLNLYDEKDKSENEILLDSEWINISEMAKDVLRVLEKELY
jgi:hypothetical protein